MLAEIDTQLSCQLFCMPIEIRHEIYGYLVPNGVHIIQRNGNLSFSSCYQPDANSISIDTESYHGEAYIMGKLNPHPHPDYCRRLRSAWGPHWKCEEKALQLIRQVEDDETADLPIMLTCKKAYEDVITFFVGSVMIHLADLDSLEHIIARCRIGHLSSTPSHLATAMAQIQRISIALRLPLQTFKDIEHFYQDHAAEAVSHPKPDWLRLCPELVQFRKLRKLHVWADHDEGKSWTHVNERAFLSPFDTLAAQQSLDISVNLPMLHPTWEDIGDHLVAYGPQPMYHLERRLRQRLFAEGSAAGTSLHRGEDSHIVYERRPDHDSDDSAGASGVSQWWSPDLSYV